MPYAIGLSTFAQTAEKRITYGIKGGVNFSKITTSKPDDGYFNPEFLTTFNAGVFADIKFGNISIQPALNITRKGGRNSFNVRDENGVYFGTIKDDLSFTHLQLPVNLVYNIPVGAGNIYFGAGPYFSWRINIKSKVYYTSPSYSPYLGFVNEYKKSEFGLNGIAGYKFNNGFLFNINYDRGLTDMAYSNSKRSFYTNTIGISLGYIFK